MRAVGAHSFGGGFDLGVAQGGWEIASKVSREVGFGVYNTLANRHLLGDGWDSFATPPSEWQDPGDVQLVYGNPPCSGFSALSSQHFRGMDSPINAYMWELVDYAARVRPELVAWESVQTTFRQGLPLMRRLHERLEEASGHEYHLTHVLHNNLSHGGVSMRKRYFWVASRVPFGVGPGRAEPGGGYSEELGPLPTFRDMLADLAPLGLSMAPQAYPQAEWPLDVYDQPSRLAVLRTASEWSRREAHDGRGVVDGHDVYRPKNNLDRTRDVLAEERWEEGEGLSDALRRLYERTGSLGPGWQYQTKARREDGTTVTMTKQERLVETGFNMGHSQPWRWRADRPAAVITGAAVVSVVHPWLPRTITYREAARIQGFPDAWRIWPVRDAPDLGPGWGKGVPVQAARWLAHWLKRSLSGAPGPLTGVSLETYRRDLSRRYGPHPRETVVDTTFAFRGDEPVG